MRSSSSTAARATISSEAGGGIGGPDPPSCATLAGGSAGTRHIGARDEPEADPPLPTPIASRWRSWLACGSKAFERRPYRPGQDPAGWSQPGPFQRYVPRRPSLRWTESPTGLFGARCSKRVGGLQPASGVKYGKSSVAEEEDWFARRVKCIGAGTGSPTTCARLRRGLLLLFRRASSASNPGPAISEIVRRADPRAAAVLPASRAVPTRDSAWFDVRRRRALRTVFTGRRPPGLAWLARDAAPLER